VIFADLKLQRQDRPARLEALGLPLKQRPASNTIRICQPCAALESGRCRIYGGHPQYCREFECSLLKKLQSGHTDRAAALRVIRDAHHRADEVRRLLEDLGDTDSATALATRFRRTSRRMERADLDESTAEIYAQLTLAVHALNLVLSSSFYPGGLAEAPSASTAS
jgi:Fe-S-cluster containining protein